MSPFAMSLEEHVGCSGRTHRGGTRKITPSYEISNSRVSSLPFRVTGELCLDLTLCFFWPFFLFFGFLHVFMKLSSRILYACVFNVLKLTHIGLRLATDQRCAQRGFPETVSRQVGKCGGRRQVPMRTRQWERRQETVSWAGPPQRKN